jgi:hypothetical protein
VWLQVRFISHTLDKNAAHLAKVPEFSALSRDLRCFVADNARNWEPGSASASGGGGGGGRDSSWRDDTRGAASSVAASSMAGRDVMRP